MTTDATKVRTMSRREAIEDIGVQLKHQSLDTLAKLASEMLLPGVAVTVKWNSEPGSSISQPHLDGQPVVNT
jgi:hypothetical protein